jgi:glycosyltransferase involved in cell wall biosynthesis
MKKIKIVLLTCFSNEQVRSKLVLNNKSKILNIIRKILGKPAQKINHGDYAPWNSALIEELNKRDDVELHVISPQVGLNKKLENLKIENVKYYIFNTDLTLIFKHIIGFDRLWRMLQPNGRVVNSLIKKIKPDIINLVGAENSHLSVSSLSIRDIPTYVSCQTVYNNPNRIKYSQVNKKNLSTEKLILEKEKYFGCSGLLHRNLVKKINPEAKIFDFSFVNSKFPEIKDCPKKYNFVTFAAQNEKQKGIFDLLSAFILLNKIYPKATLNINGGMREEVKVELDKIIFDNNLSSNITITPFFDKQIDLFRHLKKSEIAVLFKPWH